MSNKSKIHSYLNKVITEEIEKIRFGKPLSEGMRFHLKHNINFYNNIYRPNSKNFFRLINEMRELHNKGKISLSPEEIELAESDAGKFAEHKGKMVPLDIPMRDESKHISEAEYQGKDVELNKPKRGGSKKFYVYVKCGDKVKKVSFGSPDMDIKISDPERRKSFVARHKCKDKKDKCTAGYWSCRIGRYPDLIGTSKSYRWW